MINWSKYFDKIYCINFIQFKTRRELMQFELNRVGILNSGIFKWQTTYNRKLDREIEKFIRDNHSNTLDRENNISLVLGHYNAIRDAYYSGCKNVLILEDDTRFLRDLDKIEQILQHRPKNGNVILYDKSINERRFLEQFISVNDYYDSFTNCLSAACYQLDRTGMQRIMDLVQNKPHAVDGYFYDVKENLNGLNCFCAKTNLSVQATFDSSNSLAEYHQNIITSFQECYSFLNINFDDYMMRKDGSYYNYCDVIFQKERITKITQKFTVNLNDPIKPTQMNIFLAIDKRNMTLLPFILYTLQKFSQSTFNIYLMSDYQDMNQFKQWVEKIKLKRTNFTLIPSSLIRQYLNKDYKINQLTILTYAKLLIPILFPDLDRMLYLDYDVAIFQKGLEYLYNIDFEDNYLAVYGSELKERMAQNTMPRKEWLRINSQECKEHYIFSHLTNCYFNAGVLMWNIKKIVEDGKDKELLKIMSTVQTEENNEDLAKIAKDPEIFKSEEHIEFQLHDQSILNYIFRNKTMIFNPIFNSSENNCCTEEFLNSGYRNIELRKWNIPNEQYYLNYLIIAHFAGTLKPWYNVPEEYFTYYQYVTFLKYKNLFIEAKKNYAKLV